MKLCRRFLDSLKKRLERLNDIGREAIIDPECWISGSVIQGEVSVGKGCKIFRSHIEGKVEISKYTSLWGPGAFVIGRVHGVSIGSFCSIARNVSIQEDNHNPQRTTTYFLERNLLGVPDGPDCMTSRGPIAVGHDVWIGAGSQLLSGVNIGHGAVIGAGSVVATDVPPYAIVAGNPSRVVRYRFTQGTIAQLLTDAWWDWPLERLLEERQYLLQVHERPG